MRLVLLLCALIATPALAQDRPPAERQILVDLATVIGEAHALRQLCNGPSDQFWRTRMLGLLEAEAPDYGLSERLKVAFNTGFITQQQRHVACTAESRAAEREVSADGQALAKRLAPSGR